MSHYKLIAVLAALLSLPAICCAQTGLIRARQVFVQDPAELVKATDISSNVIQSRKIILRVQDDGVEIDPQIILDATNAHDSLIQIVEDGDPKVELGWGTGATDFGKVVVYDDAAPGNATSILGPSVTSRTIVLRNMGATAAVHLEETGGGTDTVQLRGPASTAGIFFVLPGTDGTSGQCLSTNGSGVLSWAGCAGGSGSSAGAIGDAQFSADGAGTFGADAAFNWENTLKQLRLGAAFPTTTLTLTIDGGIAMDNADFIGWEDSAGDVIAVMQSVNGQLVVGHASAPDTAGDTFIQSFTGTTQAIMRLEARGDNIAVWQPQLIADGSSTDANYIGDNDHPWAAYIGLGANLIGFSGSPAQLLIEEQAATSGGGVGNFITILGGAAMASDYVLGLPDDTPAVGEFLKVASQDGSVWNLEWAVGAGGTGCIPTGGLGEIQYSDGAGGCADDASLIWDNTDKDLDLLGSSVVAEISVTTDFNAFGSNARVVNTAYSGSSVSFGGMYLGMTARGTKASPTAAVTGDVMLNNQAYAHDGSTFQFGGGYNFSVGSTWTGSNRHTIMSFVNTPSGSTTAAESIAINRACAHCLTMNNNAAIYFKDAGATERHVLSSSSGQVILGHTVAPSSGGDTFVSSFTSTTEGILRFQARNDNVFVLQPQFTADGSSTNAYYLGDNNRYFTAYIGIGANLLTRGGAPAQLLIEDENASNRFVTVLGSPGTMAASYAIRLPGTAPTASQVLAASSFSGGAWNTAWTTLGGGGFTCNTASNCFNLTDAQTAAGNKTFTGTTTARTILPQTTNTYDLGSTSVRWRATYSNLYECGTALGVSCTFNIYHSGEAGFSRINSQNLTGSTDIEFQMDTGAAVYPGSSNFTDLGLSTRKWHRIYAGTAYVGPSGTDGTSATLTCGAGQAVKNITVSGGVVTSVSCGAP